MPVSSHFPPPLPPLAATNLLLCVCLLWTSRVNAVITACGLLYLASFTWHRVSEVYPLSQECSILVIPFYGQVIFHCITHIQPLFIHSLVLTVTFLLLWLYSYAIIFLCKFLCRHTSLGYIPRIRSVFFKNSYRNIFSWILQRNM